MWAVIGAVTVVRVCGLGWSGTSGMMACRSRRDAAARRVGQICGWCFPAFA
jgi:hypothetical protein